MAHPPPSGHDWRQSPLFNGRVFAERHGTTFTIVMVVVSAVTALPVMVGAIVIGLVTDDPGVRLGAAAAALGALLLPLLLGGITALAVWLRRNVP